MVLRCLTPNEAQARELVSACGDNDLDTLERLFDLPLDPEMTSDGARAMHVAAISGH